MHWYNRDKNSHGSDQSALKAEIQRVKEEEEQMMREALGLAPKRASCPKGNRIDKHEFSELVKRGSTAEDVGAGHAEAAAVHGLGFAKYVGILINYFASNYFCMPYRTTHGTTKRKTTFFRGAR